MTTEQKIIKTKVGVLELAKQFGNVSQACKETEAQLAALERVQRDKEAHGEFEGYNTQRPHQGRWCYGKTPIQTFIDSVSLAKEKRIA
jgi:hypothetical protein